MFEGLLLGIQGGTNIFKDTPALDTGTRCMCQMRADIYKVNCDYCLVPLLLRYLEQVLLDFPDLVVVAGHIGPAPRTLVMLVTMFWLNTISGITSKVAGLDPNVARAKHNAGGALRCPMVRRDAVPGWQVSEPVH